MLFCGHDPDRLRSKVEEMNGAAAASYTAATLLAMQDGPIDLANYYTGDNMACFGLFDHFGAPRVPYFAFLSFAALMQCPSQVTVEREGVPESTYAVAGRNDAGEIRIMVANDSPRPTMVRLAVNGGTPDWTLEQKWEPVESFYEEHDHPIWKDYQSKTVGGHGGMDCLAILAFLDAVRNQVNTPIDVYDCAAWMSVTCLSEQSISLGSMPVAFPDFTNGKWINREPAPKGQWSLA